MKNRKIKEENTSAFVNQFQLFHHARPQAPLLACEDRKIKTDVDSLPNRDYRFKTFTECYSVYATTKHFQRLVEMGEMRVYRGLFG